MVRWEGVAMRTGKRSKGGHRKDLGIYVRSPWEANYCRYLNLMKAYGVVMSWEYEPHVFEFKKIKRGTREYRPDFKVEYPDRHYEWYEVKGWMDPKSKTQLKRMKKYYPNEIVKIIDSSVYNAIKKNFAKYIPEWEY